MSKSHSSLSRRQFLKTTALGAVGIGAGSILPVRSWAQVRGANSVLRVAVVGINGRGQGIIRQLQDAPNAKLVAVCDVDTALLDREKAAAAERGEALATYVDYRKMLESREIDAVAIATQNHWHSLMGIWACEAGKDAYVEKPISHNIWEGRQLALAAKKHGRIVAHGTQKRSSPGLIEAVEFIKAGNLGRIKVARGFCYKRRDSIGLVHQPQRPPPTVHYDLWLGPGDPEPIMRDRFHYDWHWFWNTGSGDLGNQGVHEVDICRWFLGEEKIAPRVVSVGDRLGYVDNGQTPNTQFIVCDYQKAPLIFEVRGLPLRPGMDAMPTYRGIRVGVVIECEDGYFAGGGRGGWIYDNNNRRVRQFSSDGGYGHVENFAEAALTRRPDLLTADAEAGHISSSLCHIGNISLRMGTGRRPDEIRERVASANRPDITDTYDRMEQHLRENEIALDTTTVTLGPVLNFDPDSERFTGPQASEANQMISRRYRDGFRVRPQA